MAFRTRTYSDRRAIGTKKACSLALATATALLVAGGAAWAVTKHCEPDVPCSGTPGSDTLIGTGGQDLIRGRAGDDTVMGRWHRDNLDGGQGRDVLQGQTGDDTVSGGRGSDSLYGGQGRDLLRGQRGNDALVGDLKTFSDQDRLSGGRGNDQLYGRVGLDSLSGDRGDDVLDGGGSGDFFDFGPDWGHDRIADTHPNFFNTVVLTHVPSDLYINLTSRANAPEVKTVDGTSRINWNNNVVRSVLSGSGNDMAWGDDTNNVIQLQFGGSDTAYGGEGNDTINVREFSSEGKDTVDCGPGSEDRVFYDEGVDTVTNCEIFNPDP